MVGVQNIITLDEFNDSTIVKNESSETALEVDDTPMLETKVASSEKENVPDSDEDIIFISHSTNSTYVKKEPGRQLEATGSLSNDSIVKQESGILSSGTNKRRLATSDEEPIAKRVDKTVVTYTFSTPTSTEPLNPRRIDGQREALQEVSSNKRKLPSATEFSLFKQSHPCLSSSFVSSEDDPVAVGIICEHVAEFAEICDSNGYKLDIQLISGRKIDINLIQLAAKSSIRSVCLGMETLLKSKRDKRENCAKEREETAQELEKYKEKGRLLDVKPPSTENVTPKSTPFFTPTRLVELEENRKESIVKNAKSTPLDKTPGDNHMSDRFFLSKNLECFKKADKLKRTICNKLTSSVKYTPENPFYSLQNLLGGRLNALLMYMQYVQSTGTQDSCEVYEKIANQLNNNWIDFLYTPPLSMLTKKGEEMKEKLKMKENVVGTVHFLPFKAEPGESGVVCFAIVNTKVVCWSAEDSKNAALRKLQEKLSDVIGWDSYFKFLIDLPFADKFGDVFVTSISNDCFDENHKAITWMENNFNGLATGIDRKHLAAIPAFYNQAFVYFRD